MKERNLPQRRLRANYRVVITVIAVSLLAGCLSFTDPVDPGDAPDPGMAYLVGSFTMSNYFRKNVVVSLRNMDTGKTRMIKLRGDADRAHYGEIATFALEPGRYVFEEMLACPAVRSLFTLEKMDCTARRPFDCGTCGTQATPFTVEKGTAYFAGHFSGLSYAKEGGRDIVWEVTPVEEAIEAVTAKFRERYPKFATLPVVPSHGR